jgi:PAN domain
MSNIRMAASQCGPACLAAYGCTHYTWTSFNGGTCWMKNGLVTKADAYYVANSNNVCGVNPIVWNSNNEAVACDFKGNGLTNAKTAKTDCAAKCRATKGCTHYTW